jgi:hypothetical protein
MLAGEYGSDFLKNLKNSKKRRTKFLNAILKNPKD